MSLVTRLASKLEEKGIRLVPKHNSVYTAIDEYGFEAPITQKAISGLATIVAGKVDHFRNVILPCSRILEKSVKDKSTVKPTSIVDKVHISILANQQNTDALTADNVDTRSGAVFEDLPDRVWFVEYAKEYVDDVLATAPKAVAERAKYLLTELPDGALETIYKNIFGNISKTNEYLRDLPTSGSSKSAEIFIGLALALGMRDGSIGVSNLPSDQARISHLGRLIAFLTNLVVIIDNRYAELVKSEILIAGIRTNDDGDVTVSVVGDTYDKYLENHNVAAIIAYGAKEANEPGYRRVSLDTILMDVDMLLGYYEESIRMSNMKANIEHIEILRLAYRVAVSEHLNAMDEHELEVVGISEEGIAVINKHVDAFISSLAHDKLLDVTSICRILAGDYIYDDDSFEVFSDHMLHYAKVFPDLTPEEVATCATAALTVDFLSNQYTVEKV